MEADGPACTTRFGFRAAYGDAVGDLTLINTTYGPSVGLGQVRSMRDPKTGGTADRWRIAQLLRDPLFNAWACWWISSSGTRFTPWSMFNNGLWKPHAGLDYAVVTGHPRANEWSK